MRRKWQHRFLGFLFVTYSHTVSGMKTKSILAVISFSLALTITQVATAAKPFGANPKSAVGAGARYHVEHSVYDDLPFEDGDLTYTLSYEYHDAAGYWQLMVGYTPEVGDGDVVDYVITPQLNLIIQDRIFLAGTGIMSDYIQSVEEGGDWGDIYWQLMLGFEIPIGPVKLEAMAYYPFDKWGNIPDFDFNDVEFGGSIKFYF